MEKHGLTTADIDAHVGGGKKRGPKPGVKAALAKTASAARYRDPKSGATWTGHGRAPSWIASAKDRTKYLVEGTSAGSVAASKSAAKSGNYVRGPQPALYADPKTGATWTGRGRAPAWLVDVKDRSKFLIAGVDAATSAGGASKTKPSAKKTVAKKAVVKKVAATKTAPTKKVAAKKVVAKKAVSAKVPAEKAPAKKAPRQNVAVPAPMVAVESGAELTT
jgi:DNA-binding protein H-NS